MDRRARVLQSLRNESIELGIAPPSALDAELAVGPYLALSTPTHSWPRGAQTRWDVRGWIKCIAIPPPSAPAYMRDWIAVGCDDGWIHIRHLGSGTPVHAGDSPRALSWKAHTGLVNSVAWFSDGRLASGSWDNTVAVWRPEASEEPLWRGRVHESTVTSVAWSLDGRLASGSCDKTVAVWRPEENAEPVWRAQVAGQITALAWSPNGRWVAAGTQRWRVVVLDADSGEVVWTAPTNAGVLALGWFHDGEELWAADNGGGSGEPKVYRYRLEGVRRQAI